MRFYQQQRRSRQGFSLAETLIAVGVLATALPLVFGALAQAGKSGMAAQADTRSAWIIPASMAELEACRAGRSQFFAATPEGESFPPAGGKWLLGFAADGGLVGQVPAGSYASGAGRINDQAIFYLVDLRGVVASATAAEPSPMVHVHLQLEFPAAAPVAVRRKLTFHTWLP